MPELHDRLNAALAGRYAIERELGSGGMATVWLAKDLRYDRAVAVKVLRPDLSAALGADRFPTPLAFADALEATASGTAKLGEPPEHVRAAAREVVGAAPFDASRLPAPLRVPPEGAYDRKRRTYVVERAVEREVTAAEHAALVMEIQESLRTTGQTTVLGGGLTWSPPQPVGGMPWAGIPARPEGRQVTVTIAPDAGRTRIRIEEQFGVASGAAVAAPMVGGLAAAALAMLTFLRTDGEPGHWVVLAPAVAVVVGGVLFGGKLLHGRQVQKRGPELVALAEHLAIRIARRQLPPRHDP